MENAILGMRTLNISQGYFSNYTHKNLYQVDLTGEDSGIDTWRAKMHLKCLKILRYKDTGFANTVFFGTCDSQGNMAKVHTPELGDVVLTLAMTHDNIISSRIQEGKVYSGDDMIYEEGITGNATGNHIHLEIAKGWQTSKVKYLGSNFYGGKQYAMRNLVPIEKALFLLEGYNINKNDNGYKFKWVKTIERSDNMKLIDGYQKINWLGSVVHLYKQKPNQKIGMMSAEQPGVENWQARQTIDKIDNDFIHYCKINCNFFNMGDGQHYGVEQSFENDFAPKQTDWYCLYINKEGKPNYCLSSDYWCSKNDVILACSPFAILRHNGEDLKLTSKGANQSLQSYTNNTLLLYLQDGSYAFVVTDNKLTSLQCLDLAKSYGAIGAYELDGGGSSQMIVDGKKVQYTGRPIANVLTFYVEPGEPQKPQAPEESIKPCENCEILKNKINDLTQKKESLMIENNNLRDENLMLSNKLKRIRDIVEG